MDRKEKRRIRARTLHKDGPTPSWYLVWCHEHCWKPETNAEAIQLADFARYADGMLTCLKNGATLLEALERQKESILWFLMTDFRRLVPGLNVLDNASPRDLLMLMTVYCQDDQQLAKAKRRCARLANTCVSTLNNPPCMSSRGRQFLLVRKLHKISLGYWRGQWLKISARIPMRRHGLGQEYSRDDPDIAGAHGCRCRQGS
jgi:hypothetical protein